MACYRTSLVIFLLTMFSFPAFAQLSSAPLELPSHDHSCVEIVVAQAIRPVMEQYRIPGMAVGITMNGEIYIYNYGFASKATGRPVTNNTLFEIGSISKTFTATLAAYAQVRGYLSLSDSVSKYLPSLYGSSFDKVSLLNLGTHTSGGLPLQVPDDVKDTNQLMKYLQCWKPTYTPGSYRTYANPSIGMLGMIAAKSMNMEFATLMVDIIFAGLHMKNTFLDVPKTQIENYAQGYTKTNVPTRMTPGVLAPEAYGIRSTAGDMVRFIEANMHILDLDQKLQRAITDTHIGYYQIGAMRQDLIWEQYCHPVHLRDLLAGNSAKVIFEANPAIRIEPPARPLEDVLINKTGSTNGFGAYVAFIPKMKIGIVLLANKNYPINARVTAAYQILTRLSDGLAIIGHAAPESPLPATP
ncbi:MAG: class C beta-lactamase [Candidatus Ozemobacteraceae bacterium]